jgi:uncharacterized protein (UPF0333 family)
MFSRKGQGTTEYLIILAIVIVIALVVVGVLGGFGSQSTAISAAQSKTYWGAANPLAVTDWKIPVSAASGANIVFKNLSSVNITLTDINWNGTNVDVAPDVVITPGGSYTLSTSATVACGGTGVGQNYTRTFGYTYGTPDINSTKFYGASALVGTCQ